MFTFAKFVNLRGNIESRIKKVKEGKIDATLLAYAGLRRLKPKLSDINVIKIPTQIILPAPGQGAIAIMCRKEDKEVLNFHLPCGLLPIPLLTLVPYVSFRLIYNRFHALTFYI